MQQENLNFEEYVDQSLKWWAPTNTYLIEEDAYLNYMFERRMLDNLA